MVKTRNWYKDKRVLVTGGAGFIGSHLVHKLVKLGSTVSVLDNLSTGSLDNVKELRDEIIFIRGDVTHLQTCIEAARNVDVIFHLAAFISVPLSVKDPDACHKVNVVGTHNICYAAEKNHVHSLIFSSSSAVYGQRNSLCYEDDSLSPQSPYAVSKREGELLCKQLSLRSSISAASLRYFNVYGPRQNPEGHYAAVVAKFMNNLKHGKPIVMYGDGHQTRDFIHVSKVVEANLKVGARPKINGEVFNVATGRSVDLHELLHNLERETGLTHVAVEYQPAREGDIVHSSASCEKLTQL